MYVIKDSISKIRVVHVSKADGCVLLIDFTAN